MSNFLQFFFFLFKFKIIICSILLIFFFFCDIKNAVDVNNSYSFLRISNLLL